MAPVTTVAVVTAPPTTAAPVVMPATLGAIRVGATEYPIQETCLTLPNAPGADDYAVISYRFDIGTGVPQIIDRWFRADGTNGVIYSDGGVVSEVSGYVDLVRKRLRVHSTAG